MLCFKKKKNTKGLMALAEGSMSFVRANTLILEQTEKDLEKTLERENRAPPTTVVGKVRREGEKVLHSKHVLLAIVLLNVLDCILVLGELILDIYYLKGVLENSENMGIMFVKDMKTKYTNDLQYLQDDQVEVLYSELLKAHITWGHGVGKHHSSGTDTTGTTVPYHGNRTTMLPETTTYDDLNITTSNDGIQRKKRAASAADDHYTGMDDNGTYPSNHTDGHHDDHHAHGHTIEEDIAHAFHKASITILAILAAETMFKIFCHGKHFFENKLEVFDGLIVMGSFIVDLVFLKGLSGYKIQEFVIILAFLVPWRVIRVVNSLVVAVIDHEHFRMKLMYKQKKQIANELKDIKAEKKNFEKCIATLRKLALSAGIPEAKINQHLALLNQQSKGKKKLQLSATDFMKKKRTSISSSASGDSSSGLVTNSLPSPTDNISPNDDPSNKV